LINVFVRASNFLTDKLEIVLLIGKSERKKIEQQKIKNGLSID